MTCPETEENGGVRALRAWVMAATKRALRLYPPGASTAGPDMYDGSIAELEELMRLLEHDAELRATVSVQLGSVLAMRHLARGGVPADRERARRLLREARDPATPTGAATDPDDRRWAALSLLSLVLPVPQKGVRGDRPPAMSGLLGWHSELGPAGMADAVAEIRELLDEVRELPLPPEQHEQLRRTGSMLDQLAGPRSPVHAMRTFMDTMSGGFPYEDELRRVTDLLSDLPGPAADPGPGARTEGRSAPGPAPGGTEAFTAVNAVVPSVLEAFSVLRNGDPEALDQALGRLRDAHGPLVVLSACETDLSTRDHDEALTLTTSFVSGGARNVVGSRWTAQDGASALMMAVFHHYLAVEGQGPADALRAAQLWMLDPDRKNPGSLGGGLLREIQRPGLDRLPVWAAFIHQGHPGPGPATAATARTASEGGTV